MPGLSMISRRAWLAGLGVTLLACDAMKGCDDPTQPAIPGETPGEDGPPVARPDSPIGYSNVGSLNAAEARAIVAAGSTLLALETVAFGSKTPAPSVVLDRINGVMQVARPAGAQVMVIGINANSREQQALGDDWWTPFMAGLNQIGTLNLWFQPVTEPSAGDVARMRWAFSKWPGIKVGNGIGGRGSSPVPADKLDWHYCSYSDLLAGVKSRGDRIHSTDCTPTLASNLTPAQISEVVGAAVHDNRTLLLYDTFRASANPSTISALQAALA